MSVLLRRREGVVEILTLNRPAQRNALNPELMEELSCALEEIEASEEVRVVVLSAAGDKAFCAGMDLKAFAEAPSMQGSRSTSCFESFLEGRYSKPVVAAVNATAVAGGFELVLACDLAVVANNAKFGLPEVKYGLFPAGSGVLLPARIPLAIALELGLTGELIEADRLSQFGLVNRVVETARVLEAALELAQRIASNSPLGVSTTKRLMWSCAQQGVEASRPALKASIPTVFSSADALEGALAFAEKRVPVWKGH